MCQRKCSVKLCRDTKSMLQYQHLRPGCNPLLGLFKIDVVGVQPTVYVDWSSTHVANRVGHNNMGRNLEKYLVTRPNLQCTQDLVQPYPSMSKAVRVADTDLFSESPLILSDGRPPNQVAHISQVA